MKKFLFLVLIVGVVVGAFAYYLHRLQQAFDLMTDDGTETEEENLWED